MVGAEQSTPPLPQNGPDRRSADLVMLAKPNQSSNLTRVNSTPSRSGSDDAPSDSQPSRPVAESPEALKDPAAMLTVAPPKPGPADTLYPSPSGGFVPSPEEGQDWRLKAPPARQDMFAASRSNPFKKLEAASITSSPAAAKTPVVATEEASSQAGPSSKPSLGAPSRPPSLPASQETASLISQASSASLSRRSSQASNAANSPSLRPLSAASKRKSGPSKSEEAHQDPFTLVGGSRQRRSGGSVSSSKQARPQSTASSSTAQHVDDSAELKADYHTQVKIRDFAFEDTDPRHIGGREAGLPEPGNDSDADYARELEEGDEGDDWGVGEDEDEDEFVGDEGDQSNLPQGVYKAVYPFVAESGHELSVEAEELVTVVGALEGGWAIAVKQGEGEEVKGLVPATYLEWVSEA